MDRGLTIGDFDGMSVEQIARILQDMECEHLVDVTITMRSRMNEETFDFAHYDDRRENKMAYEDTECVGAGSYTGRRG